MEHVTQAGGGVYILGDISKLSGQCSTQPTLGFPGVERDFRQEEVQRLYFHTQ